MKRSMKKQWLKDLRSGEYRQGRMALKQSMRYYCCLGVLVDGAARDFINSLDEYKVREDDTRWPLGISYRYGTARFDIPARLLPKLGLTNKQQERLVAMNDGDGDDHKTFEQIAAWISRNVKAEDD